MLSHQALLDGEVGDEAGFWFEAGFAENGGERRADPLGDVGPAFFAGDFGDLAARGEGAEVGDGERERMSRRGRRR